MPFILITEVISVQRMITVRMTATCSRLWQESNETSSLLQVYLFILFVHASEEQTRDFLVFDSLLYPDLIVSQSSSPCIVFQSLLLFSWGLMNRVRKKEFLTECPKQWEREREREYNTGQKEDLEFPPNSEIQSSWLMHCNKRMKVRRQVRKEELKAQLNESNTHAKKTKKNYEDSFCVTRKGKIQRNDNESLPDKSSLFSHQIRRCLYLADASRHENDCMQWKSWTRLISETINKEKGHELMIH